MGFGYKIHVLKTLVDVAPNFTSDEKAEFVKKLCKLGEWSGNGNMVAHNVFGPDASKECVEFSIVNSDTVVPDGRAFEDLYTAAQLVWDFESSDKPELGEPRNEFELVAKVYGCLAAAVARNAIAS